MVEAKAEYDNELEVKKVIMMNNELYGKIVIDFYQIDFNKFKQINI